MNWRPRPLVGFIGRPRCWNHRSTSTSLQAGRIPRTDGRLAASTTRCKKVASRGPAPGSERSVQGGARPTSKANVSSLSAKRFVFLKALDDILDNGSREIGAICAGSNRSLGL